MTLAVPHEPGQPTEDAGESTVGPPLSGVQNVLSSRVRLKLVSCVYSFVFLLGHRTVHVALSFGSSAKEIFQVEGLAEMSVFDYEVGALRRRPLACKSTSQALDIVTPQLLAGCRG